MAHLIIIWRRGLNPSDSTQSSLCCHACGASRLNVAAVWLENGSVKCWNTSFQILIVVIGWLSETRWSAALFVLLCFHCGCFKKAAVEPTHDYQVVMLEVSDMLSLSDNGSTVLYSFWVDIKSSEVARHELWMLNLWDDDHDWEQNWKMEIIFTFYYYYVSLSLRREPIERKTRLIAIFIWEKKVWACSSHLILWCI